MIFISHMYLWIRKYLLNFGCHLDPDSGFGLRIRTEYTLAEVCAMMCNLSVCILRAAMAVVRYGKI